MSTSASVLYANCACGITNVIIMKQDKEVFAAIALALHEFKGNNVHDKESGKITIVERNTEWNGHALTMTAHP